MAAANSNLSNSRDAFGFSPSSVTGDVTTPHGRVDTIRRNESYESASADTSCAPTTSVKPPGGPECAMSPPREPRSMRRMITPPPICRGDSYRPTEPRESRPISSYDSYRPAERRYTHEAGSRKQVQAPDRYRPAPDRYSDKSHHTETLEPPQELVHGQRTSVRRQPQGHEKEQDGRDSDVMRELAGPTPLRADASQVKPKSSANKIQRSFSPVQPLDGWPGSGGRSIAQNRDRPADRRGEGLINDGGPDLPLFEQNRPTGVTSPQGLACVAGSLTQKGRLVASEKGDLADLSERHSTPRHAKESTGIQTTRLANEETASNSSTVTSRSKRVCKGCGAAGSGLAPLVPCSRCRKGYHDRCGTPRPQSRAEDFVCGRCLRRQSRETPGKSELDSSRSSGIIVHRHSPLSVHPSMPSLAASSLLKLASIDLLGTRTQNEIEQDEGANTPPKLEEEPKPTWDNSPPAIAGSDRRTSSISADAMQGTLYKHITCPHWKYTSCLFAEAHCLYAHRETGRVAPYGDSPARDFTCPGWFQGQCRRSASECNLAHRDTGLYIGPDGKPSRKHITCYFWNFADCKKREADCPYAHKDTGLLAWQPYSVTDAPTGVNSLRSYECHRWQSTGKCPWLDRGCPYMHSGTGKSCKGLSTSSEAQNIGDVHPIPCDTSSTSRSGGFLPSWAGNSRPTPVFIEPAIPVGTKESKLESMATADNASKSGIATVQSNHALANSSANGLHIPSGGASESTSHQDATSADSSSKAVRHMAKRRVSSFDSRKIGAAGAVIKPARPEASGPEVAQGSEYSSTSRANVDSCNKQGTGSDVDISKQKLCEGCHKPIFGSITRCVRCSVNLGPPKKTSEAPDEEAVGTELCSPLASQQHFSQAPGNLRSTSPPSLQQYLMPNTLKRPLAEKVLFIPRKKPKLSHLTIEKATNSLRRTTGELQPGSAIGAIGVATPQEIPSLEQLTLMGLVERDSARKETATNTRTLEPAATGEHIKHEEVIDDMRITDTIDGNPSDESQIALTRITEIRPRKSRADALQQDDQEDDNIPLIQTRTLHRMTADALEDDEDDNIPLMQTRISRRMIADAILDDDDEDDNVPLMQTRTLRRMTVVSRPAVTMSDIEFEADVRPKVRTGLDQNSEMDSADISVVFSEGRKESVLSSTTQPSMTGRVGSRSNEGHDSPDVAKIHEPVMALPVSNSSSWPTGDREEAVARLKARGVVFEPDSESDAESGAEEDGIRSVYQPAQQRVDPLWKPQRSLNLFDLLDAKDHNTPPEFMQPLRQARPSKKQLVGNLLQYQCREQKRRFGNPHQEVNRPFEDMEVQAYIQREVRQDTPDPFAVGRLGKKMVSMPMVEFLGMPKKPVVALGKTKDELVFIEGKDPRPGWRSHGSLRARRIKEDEKFPFVYR
ncbi:hypothetical protein HRR78_002148 [Exophiala dermatitidis]|nr:hypothetical protein HRR78_002148 [Exophiala dermatitidis]